MKIGAIILLVLVTLVSSLVIDDQPLEGVSMPSKFATKITPELGYVPKL